MLKFIPGFPALMAGGSLVLADLHIGLEHELFGKGLRVGSQMREMLSHVAKLIEEYAPERVVFLGDVKHNVPDTPYGETRDLAVFFDEVSALASVVVTPGNHDGNLGRYVRSSNVEISLAGGFTSDSCSYLHGHAWPSEEAMSKNTIIMAHQHPCVELVDKLGGRSILKAWCIGGFSSEARERYPGLKKGAKCVIVPSFNPLTGGAVLNRSPHDGVHGPLMNKKIFKLDESKIYLLDGTPLGSVKSLTRKGASGAGGIFNGKQKRK
ncbi:MAG: metallophosphoesterase [Candidatus Micrarchaeota archaeon]